MSNCLQRSGACLPRPSCVSRSSSLPPTRRQPSGLSPPDSTRQNAQEMSSGSHRQSSRLSRANSIYTGQLRNVFDSFDSDQDGKLSLDEFKNIIKGLDEASQDVLFKALDSDNNGYIDFEEFVKVHKTVDDKTQVWKDAFDLYDTNHDGKITARDISDFLTKNKIRCNLSDCQQMVRVVDTDGDGVVNFEEFKKMMNEGTKKIAN